MKKDTLVAATIVVVLIAGGSFVVNFADLKSNGTILDQATIMIPISTAAQPP